MLIDTHAHLTDEAYKDNVDEIITQLKDNKIEKVFTVAYNKETIIKSVKLAEKYENIYAIIGIHPDEVDDYDSETIELIEKYSQHKKVIAIGEIGLDYHYENYDKDKQKQVFISQIKLAHKLKLPICIHNRDSIGDCLEILKNHKEYLEFGGVVHCFSESEEIYKEIKKLGLKISFGGILTFKNSVVAPKVCKLADIEDIIVETDCPYLTPHPYRGQVNEPKYVSLVAQKIGEIKALSYDTVVNKTTENALQLFSKAR
ncbi:MAG: TatD family deoxyribonuclease [Clostridiales bacterium]|nr:TatD family deoxyribonuclease [Clostridiales bacterium]